ERLDIRLPPTAEEPRLHRRGRADTRIGNRGKHGNLSFGQRRISPTYFFPCGTWMFPPLIVSGTNVRSDTTAPDGFVTFKPNWSVVPGSPLSTTVARKL